jgi:hypothetical protein
MGRVSRYKKIKAFDPFSKSGGLVVDPKADFINFAPKINQEEENKRLPKKMRELNHLMKKKTTSSEIAPKNSSSLRDPFSHIQALPGESMKSFRRRVNKELILRKQENRQVSISTVKRIRDGRKEYLEKKGLRKKLRKQGKQLEHLDQARKRPAGDDEEEGEDYDTVKVPLLKRSLKTTFFENGDEHYRNELKRLDKPIEFKSVDKDISFGDRVDAPPTLKSLPRNATKLKQKFKEKQAGDEQQQRAEQQKEYAKAQLAAYRAQVQEAYKAMKARNKESNEPSFSALTASRNPFLKT